MPGAYEDGLPFDLPEVPEDVAETITTMRPMFKHKANGLRGRSTHTNGVAARATYTPVAQPSELPPNGFLFGDLEPREAVIRHSNIQGILPHDDCRYTGRGGTIRIHYRDADGNDRAHDLLMNTGQTFLSRTANDFLDFLRIPDHETRAAHFVKFPRIPAGIVDAYRNPASYAHLHYYSQITHGYGADHICRFRLVPRAADGTPGPEVDPLVVPLPEVPADDPPLYFERSPDDPRSPTHLADDYKARAASGGADYLLQVQVRERPTGSLELYDSSLPWGDEKPWVTAGRLTTTGALTDEEMAALHFNPGRVHPDLPLPVPEDIGDPRTVAVVRSHVYLAVAELRASGFDPEVLERTTPPEA